MVGSLEPSGLTLRQRFLGATLWSGASQVFLGLLSAASTFVLARLLAPEHYGLMAMGAVVVGLVNQTALVGIGHALVRKESVTGQTESLAFTYAFLAAVALFGVAFLVAPGVALLFSEPEVVPVFRVLALSFVIRAFGVVPYSRIRRAIALKRQAGVEVGATTFDIAVTIALAWMGKGVWALVAGTLASEVWRAVALSRIEPWRPSLRLRGADSRDLLGFGGGVGASLVLWYWYASADTFIVGGALGDAALGAYTMAMKVSKMTWGRIWAALNPVLLPILSEAHRSGEGMPRKFLDLTRFVAMLAAPIVVGVLLVAEEAIPVLMSSAWVASIAPLRWLCILALARALTPLLSGALLAAGCVTAEVRFSAATAITLPLAFVFGVRFGIEGVAAAWAVVFPALAGLIQLRAALSAMGLRLRTYVAVLKTPAIGVAAMTAGVLAVDAVLERPVAAMLAVKCLTGAIVYALVVLRLEGSFLAEFRVLVRDARAGLKA